MKKIIFLLIFCLFCCRLSASDASSPMVERHIFSPEPDINGSFKSPMTLKMEKELMFTGVIISSHGKWAMIREKGKKIDDETSGRHREGDEIKGMVIRKIGNNFLILAGEGKEVRLNLYHEGKPRPAMPGKDASLASEDNRSDETPPASVKSRATDSQKSPVAQRSRMPNQRPDEKTGAMPPGNTPFPDTRRGNQTTGSPFPPVGVPFPHETPPNPFLQENPNPFLSDHPPNPFPEQHPNAGKK